MCEPTAMLGRVAHRGDYQSVVKGALRRMERIKTPGWFYYECDCECGCEATIGPFNHSSSKGTQYFCQRCSDKECEGDKK